MLCCGRGCGRFCCSGMALLTVLDLTIRNTTACFRVDTHNEFPIWLSNTPQGQPIASNERSFAVTVGKKLLSYASARRIYPASSHCLFSGLIHTSKSSISDEFHWLATIIPHQRWSVALLHIDCVVVERVIPRPIDWPFSPRLGTWSTPWIIPHFLFTLF